MCAVDDDPGLLAASERVVVDGPDHAGPVGRELRQEPRGDDVVLRARAPERDERRGEGDRADHDQHAGAEDGATVSEQPLHVGLLAWRMRGSIHATSTSASRLPTTTRTALTVVAAMTTG